MEFRVLGPLEILDDSGGVVHLRAAKERSLFLSLLLRANEVVSSERLIDDIWGEQRPESAANVIQTYVSHLRRLLQPGRPSTNHELIVTQPPGYLLRLEPGQLDRDRFETLVTEARSQDNPESAVELLREALASLARAAAAGICLRGLRSHGDRTARGSPSPRDRRAGRARAPARPPRRSRRRARGPRRRAPASRAAAWPADARSLRVRATGGGVAGLQRDQTPARRGAGDRAQPAAAGARAGDASAGSGA